MLKLLETQSPVNIVGVDNLNDYYDVSIKDWRLAQIEESAAKHPESGWSFLKGDIADKNTIDLIAASATKCSREGCMMSVRWFFEHVLTE